MLERPYIRKRRVAQEANIDISDKESLASIFTWPELEI